MKQTVILLLLLCWPATRAFEWNQVPLLSLPWEVPPTAEKGTVLLPADSRPVRIALSTSQFRGFQELHHADGGSYSPLFFPLSYSIRLARRGGDSCGKVVLTLQLNGVTVKSDEVSTVTEWTPTSFTLAISNDRSSNIRYALSFSATAADPSCAVEVSDLVMTYLSVPPKLDVSTTRHSALSRHHTESTHASASVYRGTTPPMPLPTECDLLGSSDAVLLNKVIVAKEHAHAFSPSEPGRKPALRLFCGIYTTASRHESHISVIRDTWGRKCTGFLAFSTATDPTLPAVSLPHLGEESYDNMWQKVRSIWRYISHHYAQEYDYFLLGGDDMFYIPENLHKYLSSPTFRAWSDDQQGVFLGRPFTTPDGAENVTFNSGGAGYILDQRAVAILADNLDQPHCKPTHVDMSFEDVNVAQCLASARIASAAINKRRGLNGNLSGSEEESIERAVDAAGDASGSASYNLVPSPVLPADTRDELQLHQFHPLPPGTHWLYRPQTPLPTLQEDWFYNYDPDMQFGFNCCSTNSISFHYVDPALMRAMYDYLYVCDAHVKHAYFAHYGAHYYETTFNVQFLHA